MRTPAGLETDVALKVLRDDIEMPGDALRRLRDEGRMLARLTHPNILKVHDLVRLDGRVALITEFVEGADLGNCLKGSPSIGLKANLEVVASVAAALDAAYKAVDSSGMELRIVHRDIKPANIRISRFGHVKLLDFGIAWSAASDREARTATGMLVGSLPYVSPERFQSPDVLPAADIYALGCVLFQALAGERFHTSTRLAEVTSLALDYRKYELYVEARLSKLPGSVPALVADLVGDMVAYDPSDRPQAAKLVALCEQLQDGVGGSSLRAWAAERSWPERVGRDAPFVGQTLTESLIESAPVQMRPTATPTFNFDGKKTIDHSSAEQATAPAPAPPPVPGRLVSSSMKPDFAEPVAPPPPSSTTGTPVPGPPRASSKISPSSPMDFAERRPAGVATLLFEGAPEAAKEQADKERKRAAGQVTLQYDDAELAAARARFDTDNQPKLSQSVYEVLPDELKDKVTAEMLTSVPAPPLRGEAPDTELHDAVPPATSAGILQSMAMAGAGAGLVFVIAILAGLVAAGVVAAALYL